MKKNFWIDSDNEFLELIQENNNSVISSCLSSSSVSAPSSSDCNIPKIVHFIWLGPKPLPAFGQCCIQSFLTLHPSWSYKVWTDNDIESLRGTSSVSSSSSPGFMNYDLFLAAANYGM
jgi:mannosyltransferase OCH1-like enzyme